MAPVSGRTIWDSGWLIGAVAIATLLVLLGIVLLPLPESASVAMSMMLVGTGYSLLWLFPQHRLAAMLLSATASFRYFYWRITQTLYWEGLPYLDGGGHLRLHLSEVPDTLLSLMLLAAEAYALMILAGGFFQTVARKDRVPEPIDLKDPGLPWVDVFVPSYNEGTDILRRTLTGAIRMRYPRKRVFLLDDTRVDPAEWAHDPKGVELHQRLRTEREALAIELGIGHLIRERHPYAKAGNINHALQFTSGELIAMFDADHVAVQSFLEMTVGYFKDPRVALVQTPHHFYNAGAFERNLYLEGRAPSEHTLFYHLIQKGNDFWNSAFFCGSCAVIRRTALEEVGGLATETVTEDAHTAMNLHAKGWDSVYLDMPLAAGLACESFAAHITQRTRWAIGMTQILRWDFPLLKKGLSIAQRLNYTIAASHFLFGLPRLVYLVAPVAYLIFGMHPLLCSVHDFVVFAAPHLLLSLITSSISNRNTRHSFWSEVHEAALAGWSAWVTTQALFRRNFRFRVTDKGLNRDHATFDARSAGPVLVLLVASLIGVLLLPYLLVTRPAEFDAIAIAEVWNLYNVFLLWAAVTVAWERPERRAFVRLGVNARGRVNLSFEAAAEQMVPAPEKKGEPVHIWVEEGSDELDLGALNLVEMEEAPEDLAGPPEEPESLLDVVVEDLSEGGARLRFPESRILPDLFLVTIDTPDGVSAEFPASVRRHYPSREGMSVGVRFEQVTPEQRSLLITLMFTDPRRWTGIRFNPDRVVESALRVIATPFLAFLFHRWMHKRYEPDGPPLYQENPEPTIGRPSLSVLAIGLGCLASGVFLYERWADVNDRGPSPQVLAGVSVSERSRRSELKAAMSSLRQLSWQARTATMPFSPGLPGSWEKHLWAVQYHLGLQEDAPLPSEAALHEVILRLFDVGKAIQMGAPMLEVSLRLDKVDAELDRLEPELRSGGGEGS